MNFEELLTALVADEKYGQVAADLVTARISKVNNEAKGLREGKKAAESKLSKIFEVTGIDPETDNIEESFKTLKGKSGEGKSEIDKLTKQMQTLQANYDKEKATNQRNSITAGIVEELTGNKVLPDWIPTIKDVLSTKVKYNSENKIVFTNDDGTEVDFKEGVKEYVSKNPRIIANDQNPGGGSKSPSGQPNVKTMKRSDYDKLSHSEQANAVIVDKIKIVD